jgi:predicted GIY-YIG superfamily endonuclease
VRCADRSLYTGITNDLQRRIDQHNSGTASRYTRSRLPVELVYREGCRDKSAALKKEYRVKSLSRSAKEAYIAGKTRTAAARARSRVTPRRVAPPPVP